MCPDTRIPSDSVEIKDLLFEKMRWDYDERGIYATEMLKTAAYCIRQAIEEIFKGVEIERKRLASIAKQAIKAKNNILRGGDCPNSEGCQNLFNIIGDMDS